MKAIIKIIEIYIMRIFVRILYIFPIKKNRIVINSYRGSQYSCNPKYISEYLVDNYPNRFEIIWAFNDLDKFSFLKKDGIKLVKYHSLRHIFFEATAKVSINNIGSYSYLPLRKKQFHINTCHGGAGCKTMGLTESANSNLMKKTIQMSTDETNIITSTSKEFDKDIAIGDLGFKGDTFKCGFPRNDVIFKQKNGEVNLKDKICKYYDISSDSYIVLYAPTWRYNSTASLIDFDRLSKIYKKKGINNVKFVVRMHHLTLSSVKLPDYVIDASKYPDMQELLCASDTLITDYSSCTWDYSILGRPVFLYATDYEEYQAERGFHIDAFEMGFPLCKNMESLEEAIFKATDTDAKKKCESFRKKMGSYEDGTACEQLCKMFIDL